MRIFDYNGNELHDVDYEKGYLTADVLFIKHHEAIEAVEEQGHFEIIKEYPNGGKEAVYIVDVEAVEPKDAWDEYEDILRYVEYTAEELAEIEAERNKPTPEQRIAELEAALELLLSGAVE